MQRHHLIRGLWLALWVLAARAPAAGEAAWPGALRVVTWNVENLFDTEDDPDNPGDDAWTPNGWERWTERLYRLKLDRLAEVLGPLDADLLAFSEIENRRVLDDLRAVLSHRYGRDYPYVIHREGPDHRGIDIALLSRHEPVRARWITPVEAQRDILIVDFDARGQPLTVLVNHWKSQLGRREESDAIRTEQARAARFEVDRALKDAPGAAVMVIGDFNDEFDSPIMVDGLGSAIDRAAALADPSGRRLYNLHAGLAPEERGTLYYRPRKRWSAFDSMSVSRALLAGPAAGQGGWRVQEGSYRVIRRPEMMTEDGAPKPFRRDRTKGAAPWTYITGYADHFPVMVTLEWVQP